MIMRRSSDQLLLPVNPVFLWLSLFVAMGLNMVPLGHAPILPDVMALVLVFWNVHQPRRVGVGAAFVFGLLMDVHAGSLLGQHALSYTLLSFLAITIHRRGLWVSLFEQVLHVLPLFYASALVALAVRLLAGDGFPGWGVLIAPALEGLLWPVVTWLLLAPQRRPPDPDKNRPL